MSLIIIDLLRLSYIVFWRWFTKLFDRFGKTGGNCIDWALALSELKRLHQIWSSLVMVRNRVKLPQNSAVLKWNASLVWNSELCKTCLLSWYAFLMYSLCFCYVQWLICMFVGKDVVVFRVLLLSWLFDLSFSETTLLLFFAVIWDLCSLSPS